MHAGDTLSRLQKARTRLELLHGRPATIRELSEECGITPAVVADVATWNREPVSLSMTIGEDGDTELSDRVGDPNALSPRERQVLELRYGLDGRQPRTLDEVGRAFNVTRERIRQIEARAMSKLRHPSVDIGARELLPS